MRKLLIIIFLLHINCIFAQHTTSYFVVKNNGDTLYGHLKYLSSEGTLNNKITVKVSDTLKVTLKASEIIYFEEGMNEYYSFVPEGQTESYFMKVWTMGEYFELFEWEVPYEISKTALIEYRPLLRRKGEKKFITLNNKNWKKELADVFGDYVELVKDILKGAYLLEDLNHIVDRYNEWKEGQDDD